MLVSKKQELYIYEEEQATPSSTTQHHTLNKSLRAKCLLLVTVIAVMSMVVAARSESIVQSGYELVAVKAQLVKAEKENEQMHLDIAKLKSPQRIQQIATKDLGMIVPKNVYCSTQQQTPVMAQPAVSQKTAQPQTNFVHNILNFLNLNKVEANKG